MNGFHVHAVGWLLVFNARALSPREGDELSGLWGALLRAHAEDKSKTPPLIHLMQPRSIPLSEESLGAFAALVDRMTALHPERFGWPALRARRNYWALEAVLSVLLGILAAIWLPKALPIVKEAILALFLLGCALLVPTVTLWRAAAAVRYLTTARPVKCDDPQSLATLPARNDGEQETVGAPGRSRPLGERVLVRQKDGKPDPISPIGSRTYTARNTDPSAPGPS